MRPDDPGLPPRRLAQLLWLIVAAGYGVWTLRAGIQTGADTETYSRWADALIAHRFNYSEYLRTQTFVVPPTLYLLWVTMVAALKMMLGPAWMTAVVVLNWIAVSAGAYLVMMLVRRVTASSAGLLLVALLFLAAADLLIFLPFVLSDLIFWGLAVAVVTAGARLVMVETDPWEASPVGRMIVAGTALAIVAFAFRPAALPLAAFWIAALFAWAARSFVERHAATLLVAAGVMALVAIAAHAYVLVEPSAWPFGSVPAMLTLLAQEHREGVLVYAPESNLLVAPALTWLGSIRMTLQKLGYFITPWLPHYSTSHTLMNLAFFLPAYALSIAAVVNLRRLAPPQRRVAWVVALFALFTAVFHAMMQIEFDHRYRLPMLPALIVLAAIGLESVRRPQTLASTARTTPRASDADRTAALLSSSRRS